MQNTTLSCMEKESVTDDITALAYDSVHTVAESLKHVSSHFDFNISDFDPSNMSDLASGRIAEAIRDSIRDVSFGGCSVRYH